MTAKNRWFFLTYVSGMLFLIWTGGQAAACHINTLAVTSSSCTQSSVDSASYDCDPKAEIKYTLTVSSAADMTKTYEWRVDGITVTSEIGKSFTHTLAKTGRHEVKAIVRCKNNSGDKQLHSRRVFPTMPFVVEVTPAEGGLMRANAGEDDGIECGLGDEDTSLCEERYRKDAVGLEMDPRLEPDDRWAAWGGYVNGEWLTPAAFIKAVEESDEALVEAKPEFVEALGFLKDPDQQYGFDNISFRNLSSLSDFDNMIWKAVEENGSAEPVKAIIPSSAPYTMGDLLFSVEADNYANSGLTQVEVTGPERIAISAEKDGTGELQARYQTSGGAVVGSGLKVAAYEKKSYTLHMRSVTKTAPVHSLPDESTLQNYLNRVFLQGVRDWEKIKKLDPLIKEEWDLDGDGYVDVDPDSEGAKTNDATRILALHGAIKDFHKVVFFVERIEHNGYYPVGIANKTEWPRAVFVAAGQLAGVERHAIAHELGHAFGLPHACSSETYPERNCESAGIYEGDDPSNLMHPFVPDPLPDPPVLRFWQWQRLKADVVNK